MTRFIEISTNKFNNNNSNSSIKGSNHSKLNFLIKGMSCSSCVLKIQSKLEKIDGVYKANVNLSSHSASIEFNNKIVGVKALKDAVESLGYEIVEVNYEDILSQEENLQKSIYEELKRKFIASAVLSVPVIIINMFFINSENSIFWKFLLLILTTPILFWCGGTFLSKFWNNLKHFTADMNTLIAVGSASAYIYSLTVTIFPSLFTNKFVYYDTTAVIITLILLGKLLEAKSIQKTFRATKELIQLQPKYATVLNSGKEELIHVENIKINDIILIKPGERIPTDGIVIKGRSFVDESMMTGESIPIEKHPGDQVFGGTINLNGTFQFKATKIGKDTYLSQIIDLISKAQISKAPIQNFTDKIAAWFVPIVIIISLTTFLTWTIFLSNFPAAILNMIAILIVACPCALGLAIPTATTVSIGNASRNGILIKNAAAFETLNKMDTIIFDKTGTITTGKLSILEIYEFNGYNSEQILSLAASLEKYSEHPIAKAIYDFAKQKNITIHEMDYVEASSGFGVEGKFSGGTVIIGNEKFLKERKIAIENIDHIPQNKANVYVGLNGKLIGIITIEDEIKKEGPEVINHLKSLGLKIMLLTGDKLENTTKINQLLKIDNISASMLPDGKIEQIKIFQQQGRIVGMVGDGINDVPALVQANVGIAIGTGTDIAIESADIVIPSGNLWKIVFLLKLSKKTITIIKQNLLWAFLYNIALIPFAVIGALHPMLSAVAMAFSSVSVVSNSLRLNKNIKIF